LEWADFGKKEVVLGLALDFNKRIGKNDVSLFRRNFFA
jgi:hypothetical protein